MKIANTELDEQRRLRLRRMKQIPLLLLILMVILFVLTLHRPENWAGWLHAFAEAGMVGALADWFAVVALFRHPLGIPIPHTAIIPNRKDELGEAMAQFVADHFLQPAVVREKLSGVNLTFHAAAWLQTDRGRTRIRELTTGVLRWMLQALDEARVRKFLGRLTRQQLSKVSLAPFFGHTLAWLVQDGRHQQLLTQLLRRAIVLLHDNREMIRERVQQESPWWVPGFVDDQILKRMLDRIENHLMEMSLEPDHASRKEFDGWVKTLSHNLINARDYRELGDEFKQQLLENETLQDYLFGLWQELARRIELDLDAEDSRLLEQVDDWFASVADELQRDTDMQAWLNGWLTDSVVLLVDRNRQQIASLISDTVKSWDGAETSERVELAIGRDLQFIRINGTLVGGLVGLVIHAFSTWSGHF